MAFARKQWYDDQRAKRVEALSYQLWKALIEPDQGQHVTLTGSLMAATSLRSKKSKEQFAVIARASSDEFEENDQPRDRRFWTKRTVEDAIRELVRKHDLHPPMVKGFDWGTWFKDQSSIIHSLAKRAQRNRLSMDALQTLPYDPED